MAYRHLAWVGLALAGCGPGGGVLVDETPTDGSPTDTEPAPTDTGETAGPTDTALPTGTEPVGEAPDYRQAGSYAVDTSTATLQTSCSQRYTRFLPRGRAPETLVVLAHGFSRSRAQVEDLGEHLASWGLAVVTPDLCASDFWNADHERNAGDLVALGEALSGGAPVLYVGHSAGGLAAFLAASADADAAGSVGLDLVDWEGLAQDAAPGQIAPTFGLVGEAQTCNEDNNALPAFGAVPGARVLRVEGADHCDFESPTDLLCTALCADGAAPDGQVRPIIVGLTTSAVLWASGEDPRAEQWWTPGGAAHDQLLADGAISGP